jgi:hypothetical protein
MLRYWRGGVEENKEINCIWARRPARRGRLRLPLPQGHAGRPEQARIFKDVVAEQVRMTKDLLPKDKQPALPLDALHRDAAEVPGRHARGAGGRHHRLAGRQRRRNARLPTKKDKWRHGVYYHLAYLGKPVKQSAHIVSPARVVEQFKKIVDSGATEYVLVNVSELREFVMEAREIAEICWDAKTALAGDDSAARYVKWWSQEYFGDAAGAVEGAYADYAAMLDTYDKLWLGSEKVHGALGSLVKKFAGQDFAPALPETLPTLEKRERQYAEAFKRIESLRPKLSREQRQFFFDHVELPMLFDWRSTQAAITLIYAMNEPKLENASAICESAMATLEQLETEISRAEHPPFEQWYRESWIRRGPSIHNLHRPYRELRMFLSSGGKSYELPDPRPPRPPTTAAATIPAPPR